MVMTSLARRGFVSSVRRSIFYIQTSLRSNVALNGCTSLRPFPQPPILPCTRQPAPPSLKPQNHPAHALFPRASRLSNPSHEHAHLHSHSITLLSIPPLPARNDSLLLRLDLPPSSIDTFTHSCFDLASLETRWLLPRRRGCKRNVAVAGDGTGVRIGFVHASAEREIEFYIRIYRDGGFDF